MESKFQAIDKLAWNYIHPRSSSSTSYFAGQAIRAGYLSSDGLHPGVLRDPRDMQEAIYCELEKERIRQELILAEIAHYKQLLESEVRRNVLKKEMGLHKGDNSLLFPHSPMMQFDSGLSILDGGKLLEERLALSLEERHAYQSRRGVGEFKNSPFQPNPTYHY